MNKKHIVTLSLMLLAFGASAQQQAEAESDTSRWDFHLSTGMSVSAGWGKTDALMWTAPSLEYRANDRLTVYGGFSYSGSLLGSYQLYGNAPRSLAPRKQGTRVVAGNVGVDYQVNDRLNVWATVWHLGGWVEPLWRQRGDVVELNATAVSGGFGYAFKGGSRLEMQFTVVNDRTGGLGQMLYESPCYYGCGWYDPFFAY